MHIIPYTKTAIYRTTAILMIAMMLFAALPVTQARAVSLDITSVASGTWEATAWPNTQRSGTITVTAGDSNVVGTGTAFLTELSVGNIIRTTGSTQIGTIASITSNTTLTLTNSPTTSRTDIAYLVQGVGPADNVTIANTNNVTIATNAINQSGTITVNSGGTLTVSDPGTIFSTLIVNGTVTGTSGNEFGALTINNGGLVTAGTNGTYTASSLTINSGGTMNVSRAFTVSGATSIAGTINFSSTSVTSRAMVFTGPVTLNSGAIWTEPASGNNGANNTYDYQNNFTNNASTFTTSDTATHTFSGTGGSISGTTSTSIAKAEITGTYTNNGTLTVGTLLSGVGSMTNSATGTLNLGGTSSISTLANAGTVNKTDAGPITTDLANFTNTGTINLNGTGTIAGITNNAGGIVNLTNSGSIYAFDNATATSTLNILALDPVPNISNLTVSAAGNTVNYGGNGDQTVKSITYNNLVFSGSGTKSITMPSDSTLTNGNLSIASTGTAKAGVTGSNLSVVALTLGGSGKTSGTWGSTSSAATNQDDNFFTLTTGYLNVVSDTRAPQTISFTSTAPAQPTVGGPTYTPTATASSGLTVTFSIDATASSVCSISASVVSFLANGTCVINASQAGDSSYLPADQQQSFDVKTAQTISFTSTAPVGAVVAGGTYTPTATATSGLPVTFTIDSTAALVCSINAGVISFDAVGTCVINANQAGDSTYHPAPQVQQSFTISKNSQTISFTSTAPVGAMVGGVYMPTATATSSLPVTFTIDATASSICSINTGVVSFDAVGTCVINANQAGDTEYNAAPQVQQSFDISDAIIRFPSADFDGDGKTDVAVFRPSNSTWYIQGQGSFVFGQAGDIPVPADYNGDGKDEAAVFRPSNSTWYIRGQGSQLYGTAGDIPVVADYNGDGKADIAVFRPSNSTWYIKGQGSQLYGTAGDIPVVADYNGDGKADIAVFRASNSTWYIKGIGPQLYGTVGDIPVVADYNGDGKADIAVFRPTNSTWYLKGIGPQVYGTVGDVPVIGDYDGDGKADIAVFRASNSTWYLKGVGPRVFGIAGDIPV